MCQAFGCGADNAAGRHGDARIGSRTKLRACWLFARPWLVDPHLLDHVPIRLVAVLTSPIADCSFRWYSAHHHRRFPVVLLICDHRPDCSRHIVGKSDSHDPGSPPPRPFHVTTNIAPMMSNRRIVNRRPILALRIASSIMLPNS